MTNGWPSPQQAGWRPDPHAQWQERWWNGANWTEHVRPVQRANMPPASAPFQNRHSVPPYGPSAPFHDPHAAPQYGPRPGAVGWGGATRTPQPRSFAPWGIAIGIAALLIIIVIAAIVILGPIVNSATTTATAQEMSEVEAQIEADIASQFGSPVEVDCPTSPSFARGSIIECIGSASDGTRVLIEIRVQDDARNFVWEVVR